MKFLKLRLDAPNGAEEAGRLAMASKVSETGSS